jgi:hypothetical protein
VERRGELHGAAHSGELGRNSDKRFTRREGLPRRADTSSGCGRAKRCSWHDVVDGGELLWPGEPTPASGSA